MGRNRGGGFTLVEVLVALVVMSVGLLGIAALYLEGLRAGRTAVYRTTAITLAADMADRIRANRDGGGAYAGTGPVSDPGLACVNGDVDCTPADLAADDWFEWRQRITEQLPQGAFARIDVDGAGPVSYLITLEWPEIGQDTPADYRLRVTL